MTNLPMHIAIELFNHSFFFRLFFQFFNATHMFESMNLVQEALEEVTEASFNASNCSTGFVMMPQFWQINFL